MNKQDHIEQQIVEAFADVPYPGDSNIGYDNGSVYWDVQEVVSDFKGKDWRELDVDFLRDRQPEGLYLMSLEAFRFFLPAYLLASTKYYDEADIVCDYTLGKVTPPEDREGEEMEKFRGSFRDFSSLQMNAIAVFVRFLLDEHREDYPCDDLDGTYSYWIGQARLARPA